MLFLQHWAVNCSVPFRLSNKTYAECFQRTSRILCNDLEILLEVELLHSLVGWDHSKAGFRLACRSPYCRFVAWSSLAVSELQFSVDMPLGLFHQVASLHSWIEVICLRPAALDKAAEGYWLIGLTLLTAWSSLCGKWLLCSYTNITIKAAIGWAVS